MRIAKRRRKCKCGCGRSFLPQVGTQQYLNHTHKNRAGQARLRKRAREHAELQARLHVNTQASVSADD